MKRQMIMLAMLCGPALAQDGPAPAEPPPVPPPPACTSEQHRQFDFWVGHWHVTVGGQPAGENHIELLHQDCVLAESWTSAQGNFSGSSVNIYDAAGGQWHQSWVDSSGTLLQLDGAFRDGKMVLEGSRPGPTGEEIVNRITWTPNEDGTVRQHWETRSGGGEWTTAFDGLYRRAPEE